MEWTVFVLVWVLLPVGLLLGGFAFLLWQSFRFQSPTYFLLGVSLLAAAAHKLYGLTLPLESYTVASLLTPRTAVLTALYVMAGGLTVLLPLVRSRSTLPDLRSRLAFYRTLWRAAPESLLLVDPDDATVLEANEAATRILGREREDLIGVSFTDLDRRADDRRPWTERMQELEAGRRLKREGEFHGNGPQQPVEVRERLVTIGGRTHVLVAARDISARKRYESELKNLSFTSQLSGLPSREAMLDRIRTASERANRRENYRFALIVIRLTLRTDPAEIDGFNVEGRLLKQVSERLKTAIRDMDELAHVDDRVFVVLLEELKNPDDELIVARRIAERFENPLEIDGQSIPVEVCLGIRTADAPGESSDLLAEARQAMLEASKNPGTPYVRYAESGPSGTREPKT